MQSNKISHKINDVDEDYAIQRKDMFEKIGLQNNSLVLHNALWMCQDLWYPMYNPVITYVLRRILTMGIFTGHMSRFLFISLSLLDYNALITWICGSQLWLHIYVSAQIWVKLKLMDKGLLVIEWQFPKIILLDILYLRPRLIIFLI